MSCSPTAPRPDPAQVKGSRRLRGYLHRLRDGDESRRGLPLLARCRKSRGAWRPGRREPAREGARRHGDPAGRPFRRAAAKITILGAGVRAAMPCGLAVGSGARVYALDRSLDVLRGIEAEFVRAGRDGVLEPDAIEQHVLSATSSSAQSCYRARLRQSSYRLDGEGHETARWWSTSRSTRAAACENLAAVPPRRIPPTWWTTGAYCVTNIPARCSYFAYALTTHAALRARARQTGLEAGARR